MFRPRRRRLKSYQLSRLVPNILTLLSTCAGLTAIRWGLTERWEQAVLAIFVAAILDGLDGRIARLLNSTSKFGAELDSLSDFVAFGVSPALLLYIWALEDAGRLGWIVTLLYALATGLRLARFNTLLEKDAPPPWASRFFSGVPAPAGAGLVLLPMILNIQYGPGLFDQPIFVGFVMVVVAGLMISRFPTFSFKRVKIPSHQVVFAMIAIGILAASMVSAPWITLSTLLFAYLATFPFSIAAYNRLQKEAKAARMGGSKTAPPP